MFFRWCSLKLSDLVSITFISRLINPGDFFIGTKKEIFILTPGYMNKNFVVLFKTVLLYTSLFVF